MPDEVPERRLAPSYDHASSLGFQISETSVPSASTRGTTGETSRRSPTEAAVAPFPVKPALTDLAATPATAPVPWAIGATSCVG